MTPVSVGDSAAAGAADDVTVTSPPAPGVAGGDDGLRRPSRASMRRCSSL